MPTMHNTPPQPDQGAITVWAEREHAVSAFRISAPAGAVQVLDLDLRDVLPAATPTAVEETLGPIVYPDLLAYKRSSAWRLAQVLEALGVDAGELEDLGQLEEAEEAKPAEPDDGAEKGEPDSYDFTSYPPGYQHSIPATPREVFELVQGAVHGLISAAVDASGDACTITRETEAAVIEAGQRVLESRWPGAFRVGCEFGDGKLAITLRPLINEAEHAAAWAAYMTEHVPLGYEVEGIGGRVEWACPERPSEGRAEAFYVDAIAACWRAYLAHDANVAADLLALAGVWGDGMCPTEGVQAERARWVSSWTLRERGQAMRWAAATCLRASDHDDVTVPPRPACLDQGRPA
jgi:hypothetical protein